jgi:hypothetical protein
MDTTFCIDALEKALDVSTPTIFNTDQGAQFTSLSTELFQQALHINAPWLIKSIDFNAEEKRLDIQIDFKRGSTFADPDEGDHLIFQKSQ